MQQHDSLEESGSQSADSLDLKKITLYMKGCAIIDQVLKTGRALGLELSETRLLAVKEAERLTGMDFSQFSERIPGKESDAPLATEFFAALAVLPDRVFGKCVGKKDGRLLVQLPVALEALAKSGTSFERRALYNHFRNHPAFVEAYRPYFVSFDCSPKKAVKAWAFDPAKLPALAERAANV